MTRDALDRAFEREEGRLHKSHENGDLSAEQLRAELRELARDYRDAEREEAAEWAERGGWG